ncbi:MAG: L,D-transpeptidase [Anaerolineales bacterium]|nr:L,D-transpeptidase [Anaerolineales bacterium]
MKNQFSRRDFLKLGLLSLSTLAFRGHPPFTNPQDDLPPEEKALIPRWVGRVTVDWIGLYRRPSFSSGRQAQIRRDTLINLFEKVESRHGPTHNPTWYRAQGGYVHSGYLQLVRPHFNLPLSEIPATGQLAELTVVSVQTLRYLRSAGWQPLYRLYYSSVHWITDLISGPDGTAWYEITDDLLRIRHCLPAKYMRPIAPDEFSPIASDVPAAEKRIEVSIPAQTMTAYEADRIVFHTKVSTGMPDFDVPDGEIPTDTPGGRFYISNKMPSRHMGDGEITSDPNAYELLGVPWCCFFVSTGVAFHGTYWHNNFGRPMSHGCVNMLNEDAKWLYRWTAPAMSPSDWHRLERGTMVDVIT